MASQDSNGSTDIMWKSLKVDLAENRAIQTEQLQALKGVMLRLPQRSKRRKTLGFFDIFKKKYFKRKALKKVTQIFRAWKRKLKQLKKATVAKTNCFSTMNFVVHDTASQNTEKHIPTYEESSINQALVPPAKDQSVQTENGLFKNGSAQTNPSIILPTSVDHLYRSSNFPAPVFIIPSTTVPWIQPVSHPVGTCMLPHSYCNHCLLNSDSSTHKSSMDSSCVASHNSNGPGQSFIKDNVEQLLKQFLSKLCAGDISQSSIPKNVGNPETNQTPNLVSSNPVSSNPTTVQDSSTLISKICPANNASQMKVSADFVSLTSLSRETMPKSTTPDLLRNNQVNFMSEGIRNHDLTNSTVPCTEGVVNAPQPINVLSLNVNNLATKTKHTLQEHPSYQFQPISKGPLCSPVVQSLEKNQAQEVNTFSRPKIFLHHTGKTDDKKNSDCEEKGLTMSVSKHLKTSSSENPQMTHLTNLRDVDVLPLSPAKTSNLGSSIAYQKGTANLSPIGKKIIENNVSSKGTGRESEKSDKPSPKVKDVNGNPSNNAMKSRIRESDRMFSSNNPACRNDLEEDTVQNNVRGIPLSTSAVNFASSDIVSKRNNAETLTSVQANSPPQHDITNIDLPLKTNMKVKKNHELKVLSRVKETDLVITPRNEMVKSPAFEEIDPAEMERVLCVCRQHEQLLEPVGSRSSSPALIFKKKQKPSKLPSELCQDRILQHSPPKRQRSSSPSALQILDDEAKKPALDDEDDVPECSPQSAIPPPKRHRLSLMKNPPLPLQVIYQKAKVTKETGKVSLTTISEPTADLLENGSAVKSPDTEAATLDGQQVEKTTVFSDTVSNKKSQVVRSSKSLQFCSTLLNGKDSNSEEQQPNKKTNSSSAKTVNPSRSSKKTIQKNKDPDGSISSAKDNGSPNCFIDQIKERADKLKKQWLLEKFIDETAYSVPFKFAVPTIRASSPAVSEATGSGQADFLSERKMSELRKISVVEVSKAHDTVTHALLNPWRGLNVKCVTRGFVCPTFETKKVSRCLWDLRSNAKPEEVIKRIIELEWKDIQHCALKALATMFILALSRQVPFVFEAESRDDDDSCSISSDLDLNGKKKLTPVRAVASKHIFKGESIEGLSGLLMKMSKTDKEKLKSWAFPKFKQGRDWVLLGPLAFVKRKHASCNLQAYILQSEVIMVKATRQILCGERLCVSFASLAKSLSK